MDIRGAAAAIDWALHAGTRLFAASAITTSASVSLDSAPEGTPSSDVSADAEPIVITSASAGPETAPASEVAVSAEPTGGTANASMNPKGALEGTPTVDVTIEAKSVPTEEYIFFVSPAAGFVVQVPRRSLEGLVAQQPERRSDVHAREQAPDNEKWTPRQSWLAWLLTNEKAYWHTLLALILAAVLGFGMLYGVQVLFGSETAAGTSLLASIAAAFTWFKRLFGG